MLGHQIHFFLSLLKLMTRVACCQKPHRYYLKYFSKNFSNPQKLTFFPPSQYSKPQEMPSNSHMYCCVLYLVSLVTFHKVTDVKDISFNSSLLILAINISRIMLSLTSF